MHIGYLHYLYGDDTALNHVRQFADAVHFLDHSLTVYAMNLAPAGGQVLAPIAPWLRMRRSLKRRFSRYLHEPKELLWNVRYVQKETNLLRSAGLDALLVRNHLFGASCVPVARRLRLPLVLEVNSPAVEAAMYSGKYWHLPRVAEWIEGWTLRRTDAVTVVSSALRDHLMGRHGIPAEKFTIAANGADVDLFRPDVVPDPSVRGRVGDGPVIGFVGSFQKWHGPNILARMMVAVGGARPAARFVIVGDGPEAAIVRNGILALDGRALFLGRVPHARVPGLVATFDIGVMPESGFYMSPLKVIEYMAAGKPVVAPDYGPLREVIENGVHGVLFQPGNLDALVSAVLRLVDDAELRRSLGAAAAARARASLSWRENARKVVAACERARTALASGHARP